MKRITLDEYADWPEEIVELKPQITEGGILIAVSFPDRKANPFFTLYKEVKKKEGK